MKNDLVEFNLVISNNPPEEWFISQYGRNLIDKLKKESLTIYNGKCAGCGHEPPGTRMDECLHLHIYDVNTVKPDLTKGVVLCKMCHSTQHIEDAIKNKWISFVNSIHSQNHLIRLTRANQVYGAFTKREIIQLKKTPEQFMREWYIGEVKFTPTLKVIINNNFVIDDLY